MILFVDTYLSEVALSPNRRLQQLLAEVQKNSYTYRRRSKIDIFKYSLASYACLQWSKVVIRVSGDDQTAIQSLVEYINDLFPGACIELTRSDTGNKYASALELLGPGDPWVFFSPNNDHPFIHHNTRVFESLVVDAETAEQKYGQPTSILFSHFTESINSIHPGLFLYGYTGDFCTILSESEASYTVLYPNLSLLSLQIFRRGHLQSLMSAAGDERVVRSECLGQYNDYNIPSIVIVPKVECCRHYDAYMHTTFVVKDFITAGRVPPLFIPDGFFEKTIRIRYGYEDYKNGAVNINPLKKSYIFNSPNGTDLSVSLCQLPAFWASRIAEIDINPDFDSCLILDESFLALNIVNPWRLKSRSVTQIIVIYRRLYYSALGSFLRKIAGRSLILISRRIRGENT